jgi:hypothetical protein
VPHAKQCLSFTKTAVHSVHTDAVLCKKKAGGLTLQMSFNPHGLTQTHTVSGSCNTWFHFSTYPKVLVADGVAN